MVGNGRVLHGDAWTQKESVQTERRASERFYRWLLRRCARLFVIASIVALSDAFGVPAVPAARSAPLLGYDISWPQCGQAYPVRPFDFGIVGVTGGYARNRNPCLASEYLWALGRATSITPFVYINVEYGTRTDGCRWGDLSCETYAYGYDAAINAISYGQSQSVASSVWWLDVETDSAWSANRVLNARVLTGALDALHAKGLTAGIYSTPFQWSSIAGDYAPGVPVWVAGAPASNPASFCDARHAFGGGPIWLVQYARGIFDGDVACVALPASAPIAVLIAAPGRTAPSTGTPAAATLPKDSSGVAQWLGRRLGACATVRECDGSGG